MNRGRAIPIWIPNPMTAASVFSYFYANNTATAVVLGIYDSTGALIATTAPFNPINGAINSAPLLVPVALSEGLYFLAFTKGGGGNIRIPYLHTGNAVELQLGADFAFAAALPATVTISEAQSFIAWWLGVSIN